MKRTRLTAIGLVALGAVGCATDRSIAPAAPQANATKPAVTAQSVSAPLANAVTANGTPTYVIVGGNNKLPSALDAQITAAGGQLTKALPEIGVAFATSADPAFLDKASKIAGVQGVANDLMVQWTEPDPTTDAVEIDPAAVVTPNTTVGAAETFRPIQWAPDAVSGPAAWNGGNLGAGARVAIIDGGIRSNHIDIAPNLDAAHSVSFVPGFAFNQDVGTFWHATHVAGIVAAPANNIGTVGIAPAATIIGVKALHNGSGTFSAVIQGIVYAATPIAYGGAGANIINMSLGAAFDRQGVGAAHLAVAIGRATTYAYQQGVLVVASAGNDGADLDHTNNLVDLPAQAPHVLAISALGPLGYALGATNFDRPASYTNFGQSAISFAAPGGDFALPGNDLCALPRLPSGSVVTNCWVFDMVIAPCRGSGASISSYCFAAGTSMAAPTVAGVAALIIGKFGAMSPAQLTARLQQSADDLGKPGNDDFYGGGRVNAARAVQ